MSTVMLKKGEFGYIDRQKRWRCLMILAILAIAVAIFIIGLLLNKMSRANIFTVFAILCVLPWAKQVVGLIVLFPYHSVTRERYERVQGILEEQGLSDVRLYTDLVITSPDKIMNLDFAVVGAGQVIALTGKEGQDIGYIREYLTKGVHHWGEFRVKVLDSEKLFVRELKEFEGRAADDEESSQVDSYIRSLMV